jgi:hypothetical protein
MSPYDDLVATLAVARLTRLVTEDEVTTPIRERLAALHPEMDYFVHCRYCVGVWAAAGVLLAWKHPAGRVACRVLAVAGAANLVQRGWDG